MNLKRLPLIFLSILFISCCKITFAQKGLPVFAGKDTAFADSVLKQMSYYEKIGQLFMVDAYSNRDSIHTEFIASLIKDFHIGGVIFFQGGPVRQAILSNYYQSLSRIPLMIGIDGEWGLAMRLDSTIRFPRQMTLGAVQDDSLIYEMGKEIGIQCSRMGIHMNFAPVADINNNPLNPVINSRSFGENREDVSRKSVLYMKGMQDAGILACGKHFPGHGDTDADSHFSLPVINRSTIELDTLELYPFRNLIAEGVSAMMVAHLFIPALDSTPGLASTLSGKIVTGLLRHQLRFQGLVFTDAMNMKGVADFLPPGELEWMAIKAGNDILLYPQDVKAAYMRIHFAIQNCEISQTEIDDRVRRILMAKQWSSMQVPTMVDTTNLIEDLNSIHANQLNRTLYGKSTTVLRNTNNLLPIKNLAGKKIASLAVNDSLGNPFQNMLLNYSPVHLYRCDKQITQAVIDSLTDELTKYEYVIISIHNTSVKASSQYGISDSVGTLISRIGRKTNLITVVFGNSYCLTRIPDGDENKAIILSYEDTNLPQFFTGQVIFGAKQSSGKIPVTPEKDLPRNSGIPINREQIRLAYSLPEELKIHSSDFSIIDTILTRAIADSATPGCQVLVAWKGNVVYQKSFGHHTYNDSSAAVSNIDLYDIASITKVAATTLALMKLHEEKKIDIRKKASKYWPALRKTNKKNLLISDILTHQAGLKAWLPVWKSMMENDKPNYNIFHPEKDVNYSVRVADSMFILQSQIEKIWKTILDSETGESGRYVYSDIGMLIMQRVIEEVTDMPMEKYLAQQFYEPLGLHRLLFRPLEKFELQQIVPTEVDTQFRMQLVHGYVHDPVAALLGGVGGHSGLFSDANSLAIIMQMLANGGTYGGHRYLKESTVNLFTGRYNTDGMNRRGLGFDKPDLVKTENGPTAVSAPNQAFGHSGFTGTAAWADPVNDLVYVFLSNRVYPAASNNKLVSGNIRTNIMQAVYNIILRTETAGR